MTDKSPMSDMALNKALSKWTTYNTPPREMSAFVDGFAAARAALSAAPDAEREQDRLDADRYRFWRDWSFNGLPGDNPELYGTCTEAEFESAIDAAIAQAKGGEIKLKFHTSADKPPAGADPTLANEVRLALTPCGINPHPQRRL